MIRIVMALFMLCGCAIHAAETRKSVFPVYDECLEEVRSYLLSFEGKGTAELNWFDRTIRTDVNINYSVVIEGDDQFIVKMNDSLGKLTRECEPKYLVTYSGSENLSETLLEKLKGMDNPRIRYNKRADLLEVYQVTP
ncbi:hypothetical protein [Ferrimonas sediminum]|uniref:hypothetical protein n=1 Tax=Ferrimonas sediminum TaxID=718193 RepID=UPI00115FA448|nr:hypothetical protein [Ferrimonas sediminum]